MKKLISLILTLMFVVPLVVFSAPTSHEISRVCALGIVEGDEGGIRPEDNITRAEFSAIICRMAGIFNPTGMSVEFDDIADNHWAKDYIAAAVSLGIAGGVGNGNFAPDTNITYPEAMKMLVCLLGYGSVAESKGGWPSGYVAQASYLGINRHVDVSTEYAVRGEIIVMIENALDVKLMEPDYGDNQNYVITSNTIASNLENSFEAKAFEGVFEENAYVSIINSTPKVDDGYITVDNVTMRSASDYSELIGTYVHGWVREKSNGKSEVVSLVSGENNTITVIDAQDAELTPSYAIYTDETEKEKRVKISSDAVYVYNGRCVADETDYTSITNGTFKLIDNTGDKIVDVVMIDSAESFVVSRINNSNYSVYFADEKLFRGKRGFGLLSDDENKKIKLLNSDGEDMKFEDIEINDAITIYSSEDLNLVTVIVSKSRVAGCVEEVDSKGNVYIDGNSYKCDCSVNLGDEAEFILDANNVIVGRIGAVKTDMQYGFVAAAACSKGIDSSLKLLVIEGLTPEKEVKESAGVTTVSYYLQNGDEKEYICNSKIRYSLDSSNGTSTTIESSKLTPDMLEGKAIAFSVDESGKIDRLLVFTVPSSFESCQLNGDLLSFGGERVERGFCTDEETKFICVPAIVRSIDDYGVRVKITDGASYTVYGVTYYSEYEKGSDRYNSEPVDILLVKADMDSSQPYPIQPDSDICMVGETGIYIDEDGDEAVKIEMLNGSAIETKRAAYGSAAYDMAMSLRMGDLVQYVTDAKGEIVNVKKLASVQGLGDYVSSGNLYGVAYDITYNTYDYMSNEMVDLIEISFENGQDNKYIKYFVDDNTQKIYLYDRKSGYIDDATTDDILTAQQSGTGVSKLFVLAKSNDAQAIVIIND